MTKSELRQLIREVIEEISSDQVRHAANVAGDPSGYNDPVRAYKLNKMANLKDKRLVMQALERGRVAYNKRYEAHNKPAPFPTPFKDAKIKFRLNTNRGEELTGEVIAADKKYLSILEAGYTVPRRVELNSKKKLSVKIPGDPKEGFIAFDRTSRFKLILIFRGLGNTEIDQDNIIVYTY